MMGGGVIALSPDTIGEGTLLRWYQDYRSGDAERIDLLKTEIAHDAAARRADGLGRAPAAVDRQRGRRDARPALPLRLRRCDAAAHHREPFIAAERVPTSPKVVGLHPNYALNVFTSVMQIPLHKFVLRMRLIKARALLFEGSLSIENVAYEAGFSSPSGFYAHFRKAYGLTPRQLRAKYLH